jgi:hypothetical protein
MKFRKRPVLVDAWQFNGGEGVRGVCRCEAVGEFAHVHTMHANQVVWLEPGDWILPEPDGEHYYPVKSGVFDRTYEPISEDHSAPPFDGAPCPACPGEIRNLAAVAHNLLNVIDDPGRHCKIPERVEQLRGAYEAVKPIMDAHFANPAHAYGEARHLPPGVEVPENDRS